jgi:hypothetical protein
MTATKATSLKTTTLRTRMQQDLQLAGLGERTQEAYLRAVRQLAAHFRRPPDQLREEHLREYFLFLKNDKQFASPSLKIAFYGIRFFYTHTVPRKWETLQKLRVPRQKTLPDVLTRDEVRQLIETVRTPHNKAYLWTVYSLGLRLQEGLNLQAPRGLQKVRHYGFASPGAEQPFELVQWLVTLHYGLLFLLLAREPLIVCPSAPLRCPSCGGPVVAVGYAPPAEFSYFDTS